LRRLSDEPGWLAELRAADLDPGSLVEPSYRRLAEGDRHAFLLLGGSGRDVFTIATAASVLNADHRAVDDLLDRLVSSHMLQLERSGVEAVRYRVPRMSRLFVWECRRPRGPAAQAA
jgi:hypothetical protein